MSEHISKPEEKDEINIIINSDGKASDDTYKDDTDVSVATNYVAQPDTLALNDGKPVKRIEMNLNEMTRLTRSLPGLTHVQIRIIELRYLGLLKQYESRLIYIDFFYHFSRAFISLGGVVVPALLSIQSPTSDYSMPLYWTTWAISLTVTILHNFSAIFRFDKKFVGIHSTYERLRGEGWQYFELSGRYSGHHGHGPPTHQNQFMYFVNNVEKLRLAQIEEEYTSIKEPDKTPNTIHQPAKPTSLSEAPVPSPLDPMLNRASNLPSK